MKRKVLFFILAMPVILCGNVNAQSGSRLVAEAHWSNNDSMFVPADSTIYNYSGTRGGDLTHQLKFDNSTTWTYVGDTEFVNSTYWIQTFDANNNLSTNTSEYWSGTGWVLNNKMLYTYNSSNQVTNMTLQSWNGTSWSPVSEHVYSYNSADKLQSDIYATWYLVSFMQVSEKVYSYNTANTLLINETDENITGGIVYTNDISYAYDTTTSQLLNTTYGIWNGTNWSDTFVVINTYDTAGDLITVASSASSISMAMHHTTLKIYGDFTNPGSNLSQREVDQVWDTAGSGSWDNSKQFIYSYNSNGQMTSSAGSSWNGSAFMATSGDMMANYYYQNYATVSSVTNVVNTNGAANVYPVPAQGMLHIDLSWTTAQPATIAIYDVNGRMVSPVIDVPSATEYHTGISVNNLASGMYIVKIDGAQGQIVKQIVVSH